ncbi:MAG: homoserine dehydrogenase [Oscillospiraceae bacterium]|nr:homoserine dehydrogenase [Oscillospiraceae bacterium]MBQ4643541.1 homoserine dehydrogenase [Oscillospiraceae bacterium]
MKIAVLGHGTVGSGVCEILLNRAREISSAAGKPVELGPVLDIREPENVPYSEKFIKDFSAVLSDPEIGIVAECIGGLEPAYSYIKSALECGKSAVTSNKELVAEKGAELLSIARAHNVNFLFEASVGGGIPLIRPLYSAMNAAGITEIAGILNGTTNYILTKMFRFGADYSEALSDAQRLGYAERDPSADVLGWDACRKIAILSSLVWGRTLKPSEIPTEGIDKITAEDVKIAEQCGFSIKLLARAKLLENGKIFAKVSPAFVKNDSPLSTVSDVFNAVLVKAETTGDVLFYGKGAGKMPTASAVVADIIECAKSENNIADVFWEDGAQSVFAGSDSVSERYFIRTDSDISGLIPEAEKIGEHAYITPLLTKGELSVLKEKINEHAKLLSNIPIYE